MGFNNLDGFERFLDRKLDSLAKKVAKEARVEFEKKIKELNTAFLNSADFRAIKGTLVGEYGFTPEEVSALDNIIDAMTRVSNKEESDYSFVIEYVSLSELHKQPEAAHNLFVRPDDGEQVAWTRWLEEGASILGYSYDPETSKSSRSGKGTMEKGGGWRLRPTRAFSKLAKKLNFKDLRGVMALAVRRVKR